MSINYVVLSGKVSKSPQRVSSADNQVAYVFPIAVRSPLAFPVVTVTGQLPHFVYYQPGNPLTAQPTISVIGKIATRNLVWTAADLGRTLRKNGVDETVVDQVLQLLGDIRIRRVVTEVIVRPELIFPGGEW